MRRQTILDNHQERRLIAEEDGTAAEERSAEQQLVPIEHGLARIHLYSFAAGS